MLDEIPITTPITQPLSDKYPLLPNAEPFIYEAGPVGCLLIHGYTSSPWEMRQMGRYLADNGITVSAPLLAGHGTAPEDLQGKTWHDWYASVSAALDELLTKCSRVYVAGLSLGGALTLYMAAQRGRELAGIICMSAPIYVPHSFGHLLHGIKGQMPYLSKPYRDIEDPVARAQHNNYMLSPADATASLIEFLGPVREALPRIEVPALVIYARRDHVVPGVSSHHIYSRLGSKNKRMLALHRGYHVVTVDTDKERVFAAVVDFIKETEGEAAALVQQREQHGLYGA
ncbi:MAG: alpha/beta fold hydrolase [Chloroflexota bacterium]|nr:alpha/beta fold hydrolase [Chloroflexota bacterium]